jgi:hypothetical protein
VVWGFDNLLRPKLFRFVYLISPAMPNGDACQNDSMPETFCSTRQILMENFFLGVVRGTIEISKDFIK